MACHVGGQYPELTPYGRYFKWTGFTQGTQITKQRSGDGIVLPIAFSVQGGVNRMSNNTADGNPAAAAGTPIDERNGRLALDQVSIYVGGRIADNVGLFAQYTFAFNEGNSTKSTFGADNFDLRYADNFLLGKRDLIAGVSGLGAWDQRLPGLGQVVVCRIQQLHVDFRLQQFSDLYQRYSQRRTVS